ncbi:MAG: helix-turn-helix transcriptional regulator [Solirubrobacteraceae bacterium]
MTSMAYGRCGPRGFSRETGFDWLTAMTGPRRHRHGRGGWGGPGWAGPGARGPRAARGDVRAAALVLLAEEPRNGYQLMQEIEERSGGMWRPSPGAIYPALSQLEDEGLVTARKEGTGRTFELTDAGRAHVEEHRDELGEPWDAVTGGVPKEAVELRGLIMQVGAAAWQVLQAGDAKQAQEAATLLADTRKALYRILAGGE